MPTGDTVKQGNPFYHPLYRQLYPKSMRRLQFVPMVAQIP
jgi:hypothetical protein